MATVAVLLHDGFYGCGTGAGLSNRRFIEVLTPRLAKGCRLVVMPVWVAECSNEYDRRWHQAMEALVATGGGVVRPLDNGAAGLCRFGSVANWRRLAVSAEEQLLRMGLDRETLVVAFDVPFLELPGRLGRTSAAVVFVPRGSLTLHDSATADREWEIDCYLRMVESGAKVGLISEFMGRHLAAGCSVPPVAMVRLYDGVTETEWAEEVAPIDLPRAADGGFLLTMGRAHAHKGFDDLLDALLLLRGCGEEVPHVVMAAVTEDAELSSYQRHLQRRIAAEHLDVTLVTRFSPGVRSLIGHLALRAVIVPSRVEPFGRIPMEVYAHPPG
jgi:glycosyltransferase involved in cell wall biosynthesis